MTAQAQSKTQSPLVTFHKGGSKEYTAPISEAAIPDLWHVATLLRDQGDNIAADQVLECWHMTHDLKRHIQES